MNLTERTKTRISIFGLAAFMACLFLYSAFVIAEYYTTKYGQVVNARVVDISDLCKPKSKYISLSIDGEIERIKVHGRACRQTEFPLNAVIKVKRLKTLDIVTIPDNYSMVRVIIFPLLTIVASIGLVTTLKNKKKKLVT